MKRIRLVFLAHLAAATAGLAAGYLIKGQWTAAAVFTLLGGLWYAAQRRDVPGLGGLLMYMYLLALAYGLWLGVPGPLTLLAGTAALGAWDLGHFLHRLSGADRIDFDTGLGKAHIRRLLVVEGLGFAAGLAAVSVRMGLPFWWEVLLVALVVIGVSRLLDFVRKEAER